MISSRWMVSSVSVCAWISPALLDVLLVPSAANDPRQRRIVVGKGHNSMKHLLHRGALAQVDLEAALWDMEV